MQYNPDLVQQADYRVVKINTRDILDASLGSTVCEWSTSMLVLMREYEQQRGTFSGGKFVGTRPGNVGRASPLSPSGSRFNQLCCALVSLTFSSPCFPKAAPPIMSFYYSFCLHNWLSNQTLASYFILPVYVTKSPRNGTNSFLLPRSDILNNQKHLIIDYQWAI